MTQTQVRAILNAIAGRVEILDCLSEGLTDLREIETSIGKSRSTTRRWLSNLEDVDVIASDPDGYRITAMGQLAYNQYRQFEHRYSDLVNARPLLKHLPADGRIDHRLLEDAEIVMSNEFAPQEPIRRLEDMVRKSSTQMVEGSSPVVLPRYVDFFHELILAEKLDAEFVLTAEVMDYLSTAYNDKVVEIVGTDRGTFWTLEGEGLPFALAVINNEGVWLGVHEAGGSIRGAIINTSSEAVEWGHEQYHGLRDRAEPVDSSDLMLRGGSAVTAR